MKSIFHPAFAISLLFAIIATNVPGKNQNSSNSQASQPNRITSTEPQKIIPKIQAAILLDVSGSMSGLIDQAKAQLWNMVNTMGKARCNGQTPAIEIALYEYGRPGNNISSGYIKQISGFTTDLDKLSQELFSLTTDGGDEYCGKVIFTALQDLNWDSSSTNYKVIFIAGNEDFLQGDVHYSRSCAEAKKKGVVVNTIYCGDRMQGIREHWNLNDDCGTGSYTNINHNAAIDDMPTPYDSLLMTYNSQLNETYISYGYAGVAGLQKQSMADEANYAFNKSVAIKRVVVKGKKELYKNSNWDVVDASTDDDKFLEKLDRKTLPDSLKNKSKTELQQIITEKKNKRSKIQTEIGNLSAEREKYIAAEKAKKATANSQATLETEVEKIIKKQARKFNMFID
jgi:hypothetical protein